ncbi:YheC/YheD family protein [Effusibacillus consociatus]
MNVLLGVMTIALPSKDDPLSLTDSYVPSATWRYFHLAGLRHGVKVIFFYPEDVDFEKERVHAWSCTSRDAKSGWKRRDYRFPDVVYENVALQSLRRTGALDVKRRFANLGIPTFNPALFQKSTMSSILKRNPEIADHLPKTVTVHRVEDILALLSKTKCVYLKPVRGSGGKGVIELSVNRRVVRVRAQRFFNNQPVDRTFPLEKLVEFLNRLICSERYIAQEGLKLLTREGRKIDFRFQLNRDETGEWQLVAIRPKLGPIGSVVSNLHSGGIEGDFDEIVDWAANEGYSFPDEDDLIHLAIETAKEFTRYRPNLSHIGIDIAVDVNGRFFVLDVNPRPGRNILTRPMIAASVDCITGFAKYLYKKSRKKSRPH